MEYDIILSRKVDEFVPKERWVASLSNGETIYEDRRPHLEPAWERLGKYCRENNLWLTNLRLHIRDTEIKMPAGMDGYIQKKVAWVTPSIGGVRLCVGYVNDGMVLLQEVCSTGDSRRIRPGHPDYKGDPGEPFTIYKRPHAITN